MPVEQRDCADVLVIGGGPAGASLAILLARRGLSVVVLERSRYEQSRAGETFGGELITLLRAAGLWEDLQQVPRTPFRAVRSAWGSAEESERVSLFNPFGEGWHVERLAFDRALAQAASRAGVDLREGTRVAAVERDRDAWSLRLHSGEVVRGRYLVDASGRGARAVVGRVEGVRWIQMDRLVALIGRMTLKSGTIDPVLALEAVETGWWYSAPQSDAGLLVVQMTDVDLIEAGSRAGLASRFTSALAQTAHTARRCAGASLDAAPWVARADSGFLSPDCGKAWCAIGDAAMACDPLAGDGVVRAIRSAIDAAPRIERALAVDGGQRPERPSPDGGDLRQRFLDYLDLRDSYYLREQRFVKSLFWMRRQPIDWPAAPLFLGPMNMLHCTGADPTGELIAPVESLIPAQALRALLQRLQKRTLAHEALAFLRDQAPLQDRRLLVAVQNLVARAIVTAG